MADRGTHVIYLQVNVSFLLNPHFCHLPLSCGKYPAFFVFLLHEHIYKYISEARHRPCAVKGDRCFLLSYHILSHFHMGSMYEDIRLVSLGIALPLPTVPFPGICSQTIQPPPLLPLFSSYAQPFNLYPGLSSRISPLSLSLQFCCFLSCQAFDSAHPSQPLIYINNWIACGV